MNIKNTKEKVVRKQTKKEKKSQKAQFHKY